MICQLCGKRSATVQLTRVLHGEKIELHFCGMCTRGQGEMEDLLQGSVSLQQFFAGSLGLFTAGISDDFSTPQKQKGASSCAHCGLTYAQFAQVGRFGCSGCYTAFANYVPALLRKLHGSQKHRGKVPERSTSGHHPEKGGAGAPGGFPGKEGTREKARRPAGPVFPGEDGPVQRGNRSAEEMRCAWLNVSAPETEIVLKTGVRLARNLGDHPFPSLASAARRKQVLQVMQAFLPAEKEYFSRFQVLNMEALSSLDRQVLLEKQLISPYFAREKDFSNLLLRDDQNVAIMVNEEDHLLFQCQLPGLQLERAWQEISSYDDCLEKLVSYAFDAGLGYLTSCPTKVGTGLQASVLLHLPGLAMTRQVKHLSALLSRVGLALHGFYGEGTDYAGNLYQVTNQVTLGQSEEETWQHLQGVTRQLIAQERNAREHLLNAGRERLADRAWRALGILRYARLLDFQEALQLLSDVRLGLDLGLLRGISAGKVDELFVFTQPGCLQYLQDRELSAYERDLARAALVRRSLGH